MAACIVVIVHSVMLPLLLYSEVVLKHSGWRQKSTERVELAVTHTLLYLMFRGKNTDTYG